MVGCNDNEDDVVFAPKLELFDGTWKVVDQGNQKFFERDCILDITSAQIYEGYGGYQGYITTYFLTVAIRLKKYKAAILYTNLIKKVS